MNVPSPLLLRLFGAGLHLVVLLFSLGIAFLAGVDVLYTAGRLSEAGVLAVLAIGMSFAGGLCFLLYRPTNLWKAIILLAELAIFVGAVAWLSIDIAVVSGATLVTALTIVLRRESREVQAPN